MPKKFTLGKEERLKSRKKIELLFAKGQTMSVYPYKIFFMLDSAPAVSIKATPLLQLGVGAGKKHFKTAVSRNRIKRITREAFRLQKEGLLDPLHRQHRSLAVFLLYTGTELMDFSNIKTSVARIIEKLRQHTDAMA